MPQKWITKKGKDGENRHIPINEGNRMREREIKPKFDKFNNVDIQEHNWGMKYLGNGHWELSLGNLSDAGWYWSGDENDMLGFLLRIGNSRVSEEFLEEMKRYGISFDDLKGILLKDLKHNDGLYELSGDNQVWKFGYLDDLLDNEMDSNLDSFEEFEELSDEQKEELKEKAFEHVDINFDDFEKEYGNDYENLIKKAIENTRSFDEFFHDITLYSDTMNEKLEEYVSEQTYKALDKALNELKKGE